MYKTFCDSLLTSKRKRLRALGQSLPAPKPEYIVDKDLGYRLVPPGATFKTLPVLLERARRIMNDDSHSKVQKAGKAQIKHLITKDDLQRFPEFLNFALDPDLLAVVRDYLGELPIISAIGMWQSQPVAQEFANSQLFHMDHDDVRQMKVWVYVSDVGVESGPLTVLPAKVSAVIREQIKYTRKSGQSKVPDERILPLIPNDVAPKALPGAADSLLFVDTSQVFHYGSRVASKDRYVVVIQYLTLTNFLINPLYSFRPYPYADLAKPTDSALSKAVLGVGVVPVLRNDGAEPLAYSN